MSPAPWIGGTRSAAREHVLRCAVAGIDERTYDIVRKVERAEVAHVRSDAHIVRSERVWWLGEQRVDEVAERGLAAGGAVGETRARIRDDDSSRAEASGHADGDIVRHASIDEQTSVALDWNEHYGDRDACPHRFRQVAVAEHDTLLRLHIRSDGAEADRQAIEVAGGPQVGPQPELVDERIDPRLARDWALQVWTAAAELEDEGRRERDGRRTEIARGQMGDRRVPAKERHERDRSRDRIDLRYGDAARVERAHERAHAAPDDERGTDAEAVEDAENPDVSDPARAAAGEHERQGAFAG